MYQYAVCVAEPLNKEENGEIKKYLKATLLGLEARFKWYSACLISMKP